MTMVTAESYRRVLERFRETYGNNPVTLFAVLKMDDVVDKWSILVSANWITKDNNSEVFNKLIEILQEELEGAQLDEIARIVFYGRNQHLVELMLKQFKEGQHIEEDAKVNGNVIHEGHIIALDPTPQDQASLPLKQ